MFDFYRLYTKNRYAGTVSTIESRITAYHRKAVKIYAVKIYIVTLNIPYIFKNIHHSNN